MFFRKSIFGKLVTAFTAILIFGFSMTSIMMYYFLSDYVINEKVVTMEQTGKQLVDYLESSLGEINNPFFIINFTLFLKAYRLNNQIFIWLIGPEGRVLLTENINNEFGIPEEILQKLKKERGEYYLPDTRQYEKVLSGDEVIVKEEGYFYGLFDLTKMPWLTIQVPVRSGGKTVAAIYLNTPIPEVDKAKTAVFRFFMVSGFVSICISVVLIYIYSRRLTSPIKEITKAAKIISSGEFTKRLNISSQDEIGELSNAFNQMAKSLQNLEEMRRAFIANISHELRTPMTSIKGFIEGILDGTIPQERAKDYLVIVKDETSRLSRLVNDLLDLARMESGDIKLNLVDFDINELIRLCVIKLENMFVEKNLSVEASFEDEKTFVRADRDAIERVIINLLHNAAKFTPEGGKIEIATRRIRNQVYVSVKDNGIGINPDELEFIWDRFYKSDKSRSKDKAGTGLGLAIIKNIINEHNQKIWVESEPGKGSEFTFTLEKGLSN